MNENSRRALYLVAGVYLVYLGGKLVWQFINKTGGNPAVSIVGGIVFLAVGLYLFFDYIRYKKTEFLNRDAEQEEEVQVEEIAADDAEKSEE